MRISNTVRTGLAAFIFLGTLAVAASAHEASATRALAVQSTPTPMATPVSTPVPVVTPFPAPSASPSVAPS